MKKLTQAEEEIMLVLWQLKEAVVRDVITKLENPDIPYTTVSTVIRVLEKKGFVSHKAIGTTHIYYPLISKKEYTKLQLKDIVTNYFNGSYSSMASFFARENNLSVDELGQLIEIVGSELKEQKEAGENKDE